MATDLPGGVAEHCARLVLTKTGNGFNASVTFDFSDGGIAYDSSKAYRLLYRSSTSGALADLGLTGTYAGGQETFLVPDANLASGYYTLGDGTVPEPARGDVDLRLGGPTMLRLAETEIDSWFGACDF